jgi:hypothetical protein
MDKRKGRLIAEYLAWSGVFTCILIAVLWRASQFHREAWLVCKWSDSSDALDLMYGLQKAFIIRLDDGWTAVGVVEGGEYDWSEDLRPGIRFPIVIPLCVVAAASVLLFYRASHRPKPGFCDNCGYNLTGNVSGICPECGTAISPADSSPS